jgi:exodeoxyribonuclease VII large subunit
METLDTIHSTPYTLSELCALIGEVLDGSLARSYWVKAEISSLSIKGGHMYLDLIDSPPSGGRGASAKMRATCWSGIQEMLNAYFESETGQTLQPGMTVLIETQVQYHPVYGLSLSITNIDPSFTIGQIAQQRQRTIAQLQKDGLLDAQQLLPLPTLIRRIAVISSPNAAGYEDFLHQLEHSPFAFHLSPFYATMQGEHAAKSIIAALDEISNQNSAISCQNNLNAEGSWLTAFDAIVIIRGGGATTDLSCFDDYALCAVCAQMDIPIITGIGHTRDVSVLDMVAHQSLKTPTAVAEWLIHRMDEQMNRVNELIMRLQRTAERQILIRRHKVDLLEQRLAACNPERIYRMGYSLLTKNGKVVRSVHELETGDIVVTHLADGHRELKV